MPLYATTPITGPSGEQVDRDTPIPASWPLDSDFVVEGLAHGWLEERDDAPTPLLPATSAAGRGNNPSPAAAVDVAGLSDRDQDGEA